MDKEGGAKCHLVVCFILKLVCLAAASLLVFQAAKAALRRDAFSSIKIPELPTITNAIVVAASATSTNAAKLANARPALPCPSPAVSDPAPAT